VGVVGLILQFVKLTIKITHIKVIQTKQLLFKYKLIKITFFMKTPINFIADGLVSCFAWIL
jgi:hypothetical protein